jgi:hypothetical protein
MDLALWAAIAVAYFGIARAIGKDMAARGRGGRGGWRYAALFVFLPYLGVLIWLIDRHRFSGPAAAS